MSQENKNTEIERKYLLKDNSYLKEATAVHHIRQGFLARGGGRVVRVRLCDDKGFLTIKTPLNDNAKEPRLAHFEWEREIDKQDAIELLGHCLPCIIEKDRYIVPYGELKVEVDVFHGRNEGLVLAEIELPKEDYHFRKPDFLAEEVTGDKRYYNSYLSEHPYCED